MIIELLPSLNDTPPLLWAASSEKETTQKPSYYTPSSNFEMSYFSCGINNPKVVTSVSVCKPDAKFARRPSKISFTCSVAISLNFAGRLMNKRSWVEEAGWCKKIDLIINDFFRRADCRERPYVKRQ